MTSSLKSVFRRRSILVCLTSLPNRLRNITVVRAAELLVKMGCDNETIWWSNVDCGVDCSEKFEWTVVDFKKSTRLHAHKADCIRTIEFYGGPPGRMRLCKGTFLTFLIDRLLLVIHRGGFNALDAILPLQENHA